MLIEALRMARGLESHVRKHEIKGIVILVDPFNACLEVVHRHVVTNEARAGFDAVTKRRLRESAALHPDNQPVK
jgi:hypothetical protein